MDKLSPLVRSINRNQSLSSTRQSFYQSDYETAGEDDESMYFSFAESTNNESVTQKIENKENSERKIITNGKNATSLLRKTFEMKFNQMTPRNKNNKRVSFSCAEKASTSAMDKLYITETNSKAQPVKMMELQDTNELPVETVIETSTDNSTNTFDENDNTIVNTSAGIFVASAAQTVIESEAKEMLPKPVPSGAIKKGETILQKKVVETNRRRFADETKKATTTSNKKIVNKYRATMYQPRNVNVRKSMAALTKVIKEVNKSVNGSNGSNIQTTNNAPSLIRKPAASASSTVTQNNQIKPTVANNNESQVPTRKTLVPRLSMFATGAGASTSSSVRAHRRQTKNFLTAGSIATAASAISLNRRKTNNMPAKSLTNTTVDNVPTLTVNPTNNNGVNLTHSIANSKPISNKISDSNTTAKREVDSAECATTSKYLTFSTIAKPAEAKFINPNTVKASVFKCIQCKKSFISEFQLKVHSNNFHNLSKKITMPVHSTSSASCLLKCKYCDRNFDKKIALDKHIEENCVKIPPADRKRFFAEHVDVIKNQQKIVGNNEITKKTGPSSFNSKRLTRLITNIRNETQNGSDASDDIKRKFINLSLGHSGIFRTPSKSIQCKICKMKFMSCILFAEHSTEHHMI